jgi:TonB family protein
VKPKKRVTPKFPKSASQLGLEGSCQIVFFIDEKGKPYEVKVKKCANVFHDAVQKAAWGWRFYPMRDSGKAIKAQFTLTMKFKLT